MKTWHWFALAALILSVALAGCGSATTGKGAAGGNVYDIKGTVTAIDPKNDKPVTIDHEDIPGHMPAMKMPFQVADAKLLEGIQVGDKVQGKLEKRDTGDVIIKLEKR